MNILFQKRPNVSRHSISLLDALVLGLQAVWPLATPEQRRRRARPKRRKARATFAPIALEALEARELLYGYIVVQNQPQGGNGNGYNVVNTSTFSAAAPGVLSGANGSDPPFTAHLVGQASHGTATVNANGSWTYTADTG